MTTVLAFTLFICTGMIYACIKFLQEWATPLTVVNLTLLGTASGFTLTTAFAALYAPELVRFYGIWAIIITVSALITRIASLDPQFTHQIQIDDAVRHRRAPYPGRAEGARLDGRLVQYA